MFSVLVPLFNKEKYILYTIKSILSQKYLHYEIILIDDGSTDNSVNLIQNNINDSRLKIIKINNGGVSNARNIGILYAKYDWICFLDADDFWDENYLSNAFEQINIDKNIEVIAYNYYKYYNSTRKIIAFNHKSGYINSYLSFNCMTSSSVVIKKYIFSQIGLFNINILYGEDQHMWLRISNIKKIYFVNIPLVYYRMTDHILSLTKFYLRNIKNDLLYYINNMEINDENWDTYKMNYLLNYLKPYYINDNQYSEVKQLLNKVKFKKVNFKLFLFYCTPRFIIKPIYKSYFIYKYS
jgi:glycosyltransferase involved in cell wall biosynthesis